jgi:hypothetical protein
MGTDSSWWSEEIDDFEDAELPLNDESWLYPESSLNAGQVKPYTMAPWQILEARQEQKCLLNELADWDDYFLVH